MLEQFQCWVDYKKLIEIQAQGSMYRMDPKESNRRASQSVKQGKTKTLRKTMTKRK